LRHIKLHFFAKTTQIVSVCASNFRNVSKFAVSIERQKVKSVSASGGFASIFLTRGSTPGLCWGAVYRGLTVAFGGLQLSSAGTD